MAQRQGREIPYQQVDVFAERPLQGNGLAVFPDSMDIASETMQAITIEMRQFESIFLSPPEEDGSLTARIFTMEEELGFAGHPLLGAAAVLHNEFETDRLKTWRMTVPAGDIPVTSERLNQHRYRCSMNQPRPVFGDIVPEAQRETVARNLSLSSADLAKGLPLQTVSTGLPYLIVPVDGGLEGAQIIGADFEKFLAQWGAKFVYLYDVENGEGRTWDNAGAVEDVATGSAAGPMAAYLCRYSLLDPDAEFHISQGAYAGRPSILTVRVQGTPPDITGVEVAGHVELIAQGVLHNW